MNRTRPMGWAPLSAASWSRLPGSLIDHVGGVVVRNNYGTVEGDASICGGKA